MEEHRTQAGELRLEPADHRIAATDLGPRGTGLVQGQHPAHLGDDPIRIRLTEDAAREHPGGVLGDESGGVMYQIVGDERQRHRISVWLGAPGVGSESEARRSRQRERPIGRDRLLPLRGLGHQAARYWRRRTIRLMTTVRTTLTTMQKTTGKKNEKFPPLTEILPGSWVTPSRVSSTSTPPSTRITAPAISSSLPTSPSAMTTL